MQTVRSKVGCCTADASLKTLMPALKLISSLIEDIELPFHADMMGNRTKLIYLTQLQAQARSLFAKAVYCVPPPKAIYHGSTLTRLLLITWRSS
jgi:hypothetical protein